jgi:vacuolar-type H+-ATPase subunit H
MKLTGSREKSGHGTEAFHGGDSIGNESSSALDALLATERAVAEKLAAARNEASQIVAAAEREAERRSLEFESQLDRELEELERKHREDRNRRIEATLASATERAGKLAAIDARQLANIAEDVLRELLAEHHERLPRSVQPEAAP